MKRKFTNKQYLSDFLKVAPLSHALWRSVEALSFSKVNFKAPVTDLGCGFGEFAGVVFNKIEMGIDVDKKELMKALKGNKYKKVRWADARDLPFKNSSYSTVISVSVMEHIAGADKVVKEASRILKKNGLFIFSVPTPKMYDHLLVPKILTALGLNKMAKDYFHLHCLAFKHVNLKPVNWWVKQLKKNNFDILDQHGTISPTLLKLHELFLIFALPSQICKLLFGKRTFFSAGLRSKLLPIIFSRFVVTKKDSDINVFFVARKR